MNEQLNQIEFDKYGALLPAGCTLVIADTQGRACWSSSATLADACFDVPANRGTRSSTLNDGRHTYIAALREGDNDTCYAVFVADEDTSIRQSLFDGITECISSEVRLNRELDTMGEELAARYEELNLLFFTEDRVSHYREALETMDELVDRCREHMDVALAVLMLRGKDFVVTAASPDRPLSDERKAVDGLRNIVYDWVRVQDRELVFNTPEEAHNASLRAQWPGRLLCAPVHLERDQVCGVMAIFRNDEDPGFVNSDKNLLSVLSRKASRILQTIYDPTTGLIRRNGLQHFVARALASDTTHCLLHINIDQLHVVNDTFGHEAGDMVIEKIGGLLVREFQNNRTLARVGGDEFAVLLETDGPGAEWVARKLREFVREFNLLWSGEPIRVTVSVGVVETERSMTTDRVMSAAQIACDVARDQGGDRIRSYDREDEQVERRRTQLSTVNRIRSALHDDRLALLSQTIEPLNAEVSSPHFEILLRMVDSSGEQHEPGTFVPAAERFYLMPFVDRWVIATALRELSRVWYLGAGVDGLCAINLSGQSLSDDGFLHTIIDTIRTNELPPHRLCFEVTETAAIANIDAARDFITALRSIGCRFSLDDFGAGLSSFGYLKELPVDFLKIDGKFVRAIDEERVRAMVRAMHNIGKAMGLMTIAEFVENDSIRDRLIEIGVDYGQGYAIAEPRPFEEQLAELHLESEAAAR